ncbi:hypothetical protein EVAR_19221_1 [Eumeta japonica]|uniref:Uncharacterized protein n=1 Tax=Eumeta variegata TaxID=151549 RepID=A0A4C1VFK8_EUMVA|nr:hypothetical protein EVAR_19221_1 [Eumeta japonica]
MEETEDSSDSDAPLIDNNVIRIQLRKPCQKKWELRTRNLSPGIKFPTIQLFDCDGNLLIETNDENVTIKSYTVDGPSLRTSQSLKEKKYKNVIQSLPVRKHNSVSGDMIYTRVFKKQADNVDHSEGYVLRNSGSVSNIPKQNNVQLEPSNSEGNSITYSPSPSVIFTDISSIKSTDNDSQDESKDIYVTSNAGTLLLVPDTPMSNKKRWRQTSVEPETRSIDIDGNNSVDEDLIDEKCEDSKTALIKKSQSFSVVQNPMTSTSGIQSNDLPRSQSGIVYSPPRNKISFLDTYLKSLPLRTQSNPDWFPLRQRNTNRPIEVGEPIIKLREPPKTNPEKSWRFGRIWENTSENDSLNTPSDVAAACEFKKRLKMYRRGISEIGFQNRNANMQKHRRHSECELVALTNTSSSESVDEADVVLNRLRRRILKNKLRERRKLSGKTHFNIRSNKFI